MPSPGPRERLQPSLFDRLEDDVGPAVERLSELGQTLARRLDPAAGAALQALLGGEELVRRAPGDAELAPFAGLAPDLRAMVEEAIRLERYRRLEQQRVFVISSDRLRAACLRDLQCLFDETNAEAGLDEALPDELPAVRASVLNYGLPALIGGVRTPEQSVALANDIAVALQRFEPRIRNVRVTRDERGEATGDDNAGRVGYLIEGELWGYPYDERLRVRTLLDVDLGRLTLLTRPEESVR